jgi:hypothetical protein
MARFGDDGMAGFGDGRISEWQDFRMAGFGDGRMAAKDGIRK